MSDDIISQIEQEVKRDMKDNDGSHDWNHICRVRRLALFIAKKENITDLVSVELGALLHDYIDPKYVEKKDENRRIMRIGGLINNLDVVTQNKVISIMTNVGFSKEKNNDTKSCDIFPELRCVRDADKLDAIGAVGIARTFIYGGTKGLTISQVKQHFNDKLLRLIKMLYFNSSILIAQKRHQYMVDFYKQLVAEMEM